MDIFFLYFIENDYYYLKIKLKETSCETNIINNLLNSFKHHLTPRHNIPKSYSYNWQFYKNLVEYNNNILVIYEQDYNTVSIYNIR